ncbi:hypothetical protein E2320_019399 [Naja naja]|nr:hypothetical protein E2320_019399 [Naja naja]
MYVDSSKTGGFNYPDGAAYDFSTAAPVYSSTSLSYAPASESFGTSSLGGFHSLNNVPPSPVVFLQSAPQLSPFIHHHSQQVPYYLENEGTSFAMREAAPTAFYRHFRKFVIAASQTIIGQILKSGDFAEKFCLKLVAEDDGCPQTTSIQNGSLPLTTLGSLKELKDKAKSRCFFV